REQLGELAAWHDRYVLTRVVDPPGWEVPTAWEVLRAQGPCTYAAERDLMKTRRVDVLLTTDSGGPLTEASLRAASDLHVDVVVVRRPAARGPAGRRHVRGRPRLAGPALGSRRELDPDAQSTAHDPGRGAEPPCPSCP
ncbi:MAG: precorrin-6A/cobalt-precorrin-6A reductase, partial [Terracoccus sp.]